MKEKCRRVCALLLALLLPPLIALIKRIPVLRTLVLGEK